MREPVLYVNGRFVPESQASVAVSDLGLLRGYGVFGSSITYNREPFRLKQHLDRLQNSASVIELDLPWSKEELAGPIYETLRRNLGGEKEVMKLFGEYTWKEL